MRPRSLASAPRRLFLERRMHTYIAAQYGCFVERGSLCYDIGANVGNRTGAFLRLGARVIAVEPNPICASYLRRRFRFSRRLAVVETALGASEGTVALRWPKGETTIGSIESEWIDALRGADFFPGREWSETVDVKMTTLAQLIDRYGRPDFCKIDVEGSELPVLAGMGEEPPRCLSFEFIPMKLQATEQCLDRLHDAGFTEFSFALGESTQLITPWRRNRRVLLEQLRALGSGGLIFGDVYARL